MLEWKPNQLTRCPNLECGALAIWARKSRAGYYKLFCQACAVRQNGLSARVHEKRLSSEAQGGPKRQVTERERRKYDSLTPRAYFTLARYFHKDLAMPWVDMHSWRPDPAEVAKLSYDDLQPEGNFGKKTWIVIQEWLHEKAQSKVQE